MIVYQKRGKSMAQVEANIAGIVSKVLVSVGDEIQVSQEVVVLESMKMLIPVEVMQSGKVIHIHVREGDFVHAGDLLVELDEHG
jgi:acetyl-CoA carboxylase biotin carboxyl carrier protein